MTNRKFGVFMTVIFLLISSFSKAQELPEKIRKDYVVNSRGDTLRGYIELQSFEIDRVQIITPENKIVLRAPQTLVVFLNGKIYHPERIEDTYRFMKLLKPGYLSLYGFNNPNQTGYAERFLVRRDGSSVEVPNMMFKKVLRTFLKDCPVLADKILRDQLKKVDIDLIVDEYNACIERSTAQLYGKKKIPVTPNRVSILLDNLRRRVKDLPEFTNKKNSIDLLNDIGEKLINSQPVPDYLIEALKNYIGADAAVHDDLEKLIAALKGH